MVDPELPTEASDAGSAPRATAISGVAEASVPGLFASAVHGAGIGGALAQHRAASLPFAATPPLGTTLAPLPAEHSDHATIHIALENISLYAARAIEDRRSVAVLTPTRLGPGLIEPPAAAPHIRELVRTASLALQTAHHTLIERAAERIAARDRIAPSTADGAARTLALGLLPASTRTSAYFSGNARAIACLCDKLVSHPASEVAAAGRAVFDAARTAAPELFPAGQAPRVRPPAPTDLARAITQLYSPISESGASATMVISQPVRLLRHDKDALERVLLALAYDGSDPTVHAFALSGCLRSAKDAGLTDLLRATLRDRSPGELIPRGFEAASMTFEIMVDAATAHELLRHRTHTASTQRLSCRLGFQTPDDLIDLGLADLYQDAMLAAQASWGELEDQDPLSAEYVVPLGYRLRSLWTLDFRQLVQLIERRSAKDNPVHVRRVAHGLYRTASAVHPWLREIVKVDLD